MARIRSVGVLSLANLHAIVMAVLGLLHGMVLAFLGFGLFPMVLNYWYASFGFAWILIMPVMMGVCGWVIGAVIAVVVNFGLGIIKGLEVDIQQHAEVS